MSTRGSAGTKALDPCRVKVKGEVSSGSVCGQNAQSKKVEVCLGTCIEEDNTALR